MGTSDPDPLDALDFDDPLDALDVENPLPMPEVSDVQRQPRSDQPQPDDDSDDLLSLIPECKPTGEALLALDAATAAGVTAAPQRTSLPSSSSIHQPVVAMPSRCPNVGAADEVGPLESAAQKAELKSTWDVALSMAKRFGHFLDREAVSGFEMSETESDLDPLPKRRKLQQREGELERSAARMLGVPSGSETWLHSMFEVIDKDKLCQSLEHTRKSKGLEVLDLTYGSDCSGLDSPAIALKSIINALKGDGEDMRGAGQPLPRLVPSVRVVHEFCSESPAATAQKDMLLWNHAPKRLFDDMLPRASPPKTALDVLSQQQVRAPYVLIYTGGFECQDCSNLNRHKKPLQIVSPSKSKEGEYGNSSRTLSASLQYVEDEKPAICLLENVSKLQTAEILHAELRKLGYVTRCFFINSSAFALPQSRTRLYCLGIHPDKASFKLHPEEWAEQLEAISQKLLQKQNQGDLPLLTNQMLPSDHSEVADFLLRCQRQSAKRGFETGASGELKLMHALRTGEGWEACFRRVEAVRENLASSTKKKVPCICDLYRKYSNDWSQTLTPREQTTLYLHLWVLEELCGKSIPDSPLIWDLTNNIDYTCWKHETYFHCLPCLLKGHTYWHVSLGRRILGAELLVLGHGFPKLITAGEGLDGRFCCVTDLELNKIAGNTISSPVVGCILGVALAGINLARGFPGEECPAERNWSVSELNCSESLAVIAIGPRTAGSERTKFDTLRVAAKSKASGSAKGEQLSAKPKPKAKGSAPGKKPAAKAQKSQK